MTTDERGKAIFVIGLFSLFLGIALFTFFRDRFTKTQITITVTHTEREQRGESSQYMIQTKEGEIFKNVDTWHFWKYDSGDVQTKLQEGGVYNVTVCGWRIHFTSSYRNIISVDEVLQESDKTGPPTDSIRKILYNDKLDDKTARETLKALIPPPPAESNP